MGRTLPQFEQKSQRITEESFEPTSQGRANFRSLGNTNHDFNRTDLSDLLSVQFVNLPQGQIKASQPALTLKAPKRAARHRRDSSAQMFKT
jgi:hypothetical protein